VILIEKARRHDNNYTLLTLIMCVCCSYVIKI